jgi:predicted Zn-dependent protease with MMP-like domain
MGTAGLVRTSTSLRPCLTALREPPTQPGKLRYDVSPRTRERFDKYLQRVLDELPPQIHKLLEEVPLHVEDYPSDEVMDELGLEYLDDLCGLHSGIPLTQRSIEHSGTLPETVTIYRDGILSQAAGEDGRIRPDQLRRQIRITILHEIGHHYGLSEEQLEDLGYA